MSKLSTNEQTNTEQDLVEEAKVYTEQNFFRHAEPAERWRQEYARNKAVENKIADISKFKYNPIDYSALLIATPWQERPFPSLDYLLEEAVTATQNKFFLPLVLQGVGFLVFAICAILGTNPIMVIIGATGAIALLVWLYFTAQDRQRAVLNTLNQTREVIEEKMEQERNLQDAARAKHEASELERIEKTERLLAGDSGAILAKIDEVLSQMNLPLFIKVDVDLYNQVPVVKVWLPPKTIIPYQTCEQLPTGRLEYEDKEGRTINKQYLELCAAILVQVMTVLYAHIAVFDTAYAWGMTKYGLTEDECLIIVKMDRQALIDACERPSGLTALQSMQAQFECDTLLNPLSIKPELPSEWGNVSKYEVNSIHIRVENANLSR